MTALLSQRSVSVALFSGALVALNPLSASAATFTPDPLYEEAFTYTTQIPTTTTGFDQADIYLPVTSETTQFPVVVMLQGAFVDKGDYSEFAQRVARYGFSVVIPNHERIVPGPGGMPVSGLIAGEELINDVLDFMKEENLNNSPVQGKLNTSKLGLLGHSLGGATGLAAIQDICLFPLCTTGFTRPPELEAGIFYGTNFRDQVTGEFPPIDNDGIPTGLIFGDRDGVALPPRTVATFEQIQDPPKVLVELEGANHYSITNTDSFRDPIRSTLDQQVGIETIARWSGLFLRAHIQEDVAAFNYVYKTGDGQDENVTVEAVPVPDNSSHGIILFAAGTVVAVLGRQRKGSGV